MSDGIEGLSRRDFMGSLAGALVAARGLGGMANPRASDLVAPAGSARIERIGVQLYTVRDAFGKDPAGTLERIAAIGYREVEFAGYANQSPEALRQILDRVHLAAPSGHLPFESLDKDWDRTLDEAVTLGHRYAVIAWIDDTFRKTLDDWRRLGERFNRAAATAKKHGLGFAYHNHDFEFTPLEGKLPYDVLLASTDPALVRMEMDLYWITKAGYKPETYFAKYPGRFPMVHVKDSAGPPENRMVDVGQGRIDWPHLFSLRKQAGIEHFFVEHDEPGDAFASIKRSYEYLEKLRF
ncbi:MAG: sugar phosphate isomerase/epimerase [Gemmatimonadota bacterium]